MESLLILIGLAGQALAPDERDWTRTTFAATPICAAGHEACRGTATLSIATEDGGIELERCEVRAGEGFVLRLDDEEAYDVRADVPLVRSATAVDEPYVLAVTVSLAGHAPARLGQVPAGRGPIEIGRWRIPLEAPAHEVAPTSRVPVRWHVDGSLRIELEGGDPLEAIASVSEGPVFCGAEGLPRTFGPSTPGVKRIDARIWVLDLDRLGAWAGEKLIVTTTSGRSLNREHAALDRHATAACEGELRLRLPESTPARWIRGQVVGATGSPVAGAVIESSSSPRRAVSAGDGRFALGPLVPQSHFLFVEDARWSTRGREVLECDLASGDVEDVRLVVDRRPAVEVDARGFAAGDAGAVLFLWNRLGESRVLHLTRDRLREPFELPAFGFEVELSLAAVPEGGFEMPASLAEWLAVYRF